MPCLNEADTLAVCIGKALKALKDSDISGEVIVADNGSVMNHRQSLVKWERVLSM